MGNVLKAGMIDFFTVGGTLLVSEDGNAPWHAAWTRLGEALPGVHLLRQVRIIGSYSSATKLLLVSRSTHASHHRRTYLMITFSAVSFLCCKHDCNA